MYKNPWYPWTLGGSSSLSKIALPSRMNDHERVMSRDTFHFCLPSTFGMRAFEEAVLWGLQGFGVAYFA